MSDDERTRLEREIAERKARLEELRAPMTPSEAAELARTDPDEFNRRFEAAEASGGGYLTDEEE